jgi:hypothetical protein
MEDRMVKIKNNLKGAQVRKKSYENKNVKTREFKVGEHALLKVKPKKSSLNFGSFTKLETRFCDAFEIMEKIGPFAYMLAFPSSMNVHNVFHVSLLTKYVHDPNHVIDVGTSGSNCSSHFS